MEQTLAKQQAPKRTLTLLPKNLSAQQQRVLYAWAFLIPTIILLLMVAGWPLLRTIWFSFTDASLANLDEFEWIGFGNYLYYEEGEYFGLLTDGEWWQSVWNTVFFTVMSVSIELVLGLLIALALNQQFPGRIIFRTVVLIPWVIPTIVSAKIWGWMLHDQFGVINHLLVSAGLIEKPLAWTADSDLSLWAVIIVDVWKTTPFMTLLIFAGLQMLPTDCYRAAKIDGIPPLKLFFRVTLPLLAPTIMVAVIFRALDALRVFDVIYVLTANNADTMSMSVFARQQLVAFQDVGYGSAASTCLFFIIALITLVYLYLGRKQVGMDK
ncbi:carbohydrate ABC transporter permease [Spartinivicinus poritis]|uniref:Sugar ABC transporter permease n=1 Tax=Spartinivicinus poritis TaxID=2994640 RepID=A0ABT5UE09_9GAMM|nr:sugar ABC transporter permease [Spartinivicinus sp. A2-2]MDE1464552.1 sugar ABC transporter permease [Spartinivicinus sp. A2-2]